MNFLMVYELTKKGLNYDQVMLRYGVTGFFFWKIFLKHRLFDNYSNLIREKTSNDTKAVKIGPEELH